MPDPDAPDSPEPEEPSSGGDPFAQDPHVERLRPDPSAPPAEVAVLVGLAGKSEREDRVRLYLNRALTYYAEFRREDIVYTEPVPPERRPMMGLKATRVGIRRDAVIDYTRSTRARPRGEFDLDVRLAAPRRRAAVGLLPQQPETWEAECPGPSLFGPCDTDFGCWPQDTVQITICRGATCIETCDTTPRFSCDTCRTDCGQATCDTCQTRCNQPTCQPTCNTCQTACNQATCNTCGQATCVTCATCQTACNQATCNTCQTACNQATCNTCRTACDQATCDTCVGLTCRTCDTCNPHVFTCGPNPQCRF
jgi:hypothetical protein